MDGPKELTVLAMANAIGYEMHDTVEPGGEDRKMIECTDEWVERARRTAERVWTELLEPIAELLVDAGFESDGHDLLADAVRPMARRLATLEPEAEPETLTDQEAYVAWRHLNGSFIDADTEGQDAVDLLVSTRRKLRALAGELLPTDGGAWDQPGEFPLQSKPPSA